MASGTPRFILNGKIAAYRPERLAASLDSVGVGGDFVFRSLRQLWEGRANSFVTGVGPHAGALTILLLKSDLDQLDQEADHTLTVACGSQTQTFEGLAFRTAVCVTPANADQPTSIWLCRFEDARGEIDGDIRPTTNTQVNVPAPSTSVSGAATDYYRDTSNGASAKTWQVLVTALWNLEGDPSLPFTPHGDPEGWSWPGGDGHESLNAVLERLRCAICPASPFDGTFKIIRLGTDDGGLSADRSDAASDLRTRPRQTNSYRMRIPATVRVFFPVLYPHGLEKSVSATIAAAGTVHQFITNGIEWRDVSASSAGVSAAVAAKAQQITHPLWDDLRARFIATYDQDDAAQADPDNTAALDARATERATDFYRDLLTERFTDIYLGYPAFKPGPIVKMVGFFDLGDGAFTVVAGGPGTWGGEGSADEWNRRVDDARLNARPPDWARYTTPDYPPTDQILAPTTPNNYGMMQANVIRPKNTSPDDALNVAAHQEAFIKQDIETATAGGAIARMALVGRQMGNTSSSGTVRPTYVASAERVAVVKPQSSTPAAGDANYWDGRYKAVGGLAHWAFTQAQTPGSCWIRTYPRSGSGTSPITLPLEWSLGYFDGFADPNGTSDWRPVLVIAKDIRRTFMAKISGSSADAYGTNKHSYNGDEIDKAGAILVGGTSFTGAQNGIEFPNTNAIFNGYVQGDFPTGATVSVRVLRTGSIVEAEEVFSLDGTSAFWISAYSPVIVSCVPPEKTPSDKVYASSTFG